MRCLIVDHREHFWAAARRVLEQDAINVIGASTNASQALRCCRHLKPDIVLIDIDLGCESGFDAARQLLGLGHHAPTVIMMSCYSANDFVDLITASGAIGFIAKHELSAPAILQLLNNPRME